MMNSPQDKNILWSEMKIQINIFNPFPFQEHEVVSG